jgi:hypothetical protein
MNITVEHNFEPMEQLFKNMNWKTGTENNCKKIE